MAIVLDGSKLTIEDLVRVARDREPVELAPDAKERISKCRKFVEDKVAERAVMYGITTGIGDLSTWCTATRRAAACRCPRRWCAPECARG
jgi:histidine ammonia-lyase